VTVVGRYTIGKRFRFDATRIIDGEYDGHTFVAEALLSAEKLTPVGFVADFRDLTALKDYIDSRFDHQVLSNVLGDARDAALAGHLYDWCAANLPESVRACLAEIRVRTGRTAAQDACAAVEFEATHRLDGLEDGHPCGREHGHSYSVTTTVSGSTLVPAALSDYIQSSLDGTFLNDRLPFNPTSELLAHHFGHWLHDRQLTSSPGHLAVRVSETETSWAEYLVRTT
jgi:6-pyruvoyltetrahydropterin/6-carboxytetrahydropterin synthase